MADNVAITAGTGTTVAADDIAGVMHQRVKLSLGADGTAVDAVAGAGAVGTGVQRVTLASDDPAVAVLGATSDVASATTSIKAALRAIATALGTTALDLGSGTGGSRTLRFFRDTAQWVGGAGAVTSATQRVTLASDDPVTTSVQIIDDWDESDRAKVNLIVGQAGIAAGAGAVGVTVPRVTLASDDPAVASLSVLDDWDETDRCKVNPISGQAGVAGGTGTRGATTQRVTIATDDELVTRSAAPSTGTISSTNDAATSTTILASNSSRKGACFYNDSTSILYLAMSNTTASSTVYSVQIPAGGYYELPLGQGGVYTGIVVGIWSADASGAVRVTELT